MPKTDSQNTNPKIVAGDIGGTKTNLGLFSVHGERPEAIVVKSYPSREYSGLEDILELFFREHERSVSAACFGVAGPVRNGVCKATNLPWTISEKGISDRFGIAKVRLMNDLAATANAIPALREDEIEELNRGEPDPQGTIGLLAPGTGLGVALLACCNGSMRPIPSEGGHVDFAPRDEKEWFLLQHMLKKLDHVSVERLASGPGLFTIYEWLRDYRDREEPAWLSARLSEEDPSKVVSDAALAEEDPLCVEALDLFTSILGATSGNLALTGMTTGGIYLGGGVPPKLMGKLRDGVFMKSFTAKGRFEKILNRVPVRVILNDNAAILGAACGAKEIANEE